MKIISSKKWKEYNNEFVDLQLQNKDLKEDNEVYKDQVETIVNINKELNLKIIEMDAEIVKLKKEKKEFKRKLTAKVKEKVEEK